MKTKNKHSSSKVEKGWDRKMAAPNREARKLFGSTKRDGEQRLKDETEKDRGGKNEEVKAQAQE